MHPFTSLTLWLWLSISVVLLPFGWPLITISLASFAALLIWRQARYRWRFVCWFMLPMACGLWLIHGGWLAYWLTGEFTTTPQQQKALILWFQLFAIMSSAQLWLQYVPTEKFIRALFASRLPSSFSYLFAGPLLFLEQLRQQLASIKEAQLARGVPLDGHLWQRLISLPALLLPLMTQTLSEMAIRGAALDMRGFRSVSHRTTLDAPKDSTMQSIFRYSLLMVIVIEGGIRWWW
ncbi:energy-coupling factor transporter transmembrane protein EcfT [Providencia vermicola]|uniref:energy-coupling factor transporter transmembrane component T n=1 Tax=Providencia vermicola TaxID=333965 RepID=UPI0013A74FE9|nr:energy-coupling factor transporter transmembrane component T [Providencia vermicola]QIC15885.1 energy-coupling factor transporter transmembrane protein EcfT [Providencia vermicola]